MHTIGAELLGSAISLAYVEGGATSPCIVFSCPPPPWEIEDQERREAYTRQKDNKELTLILTPIVILGLKADWRRYFRPV